MSAIVANLARIHLLDARLANQIAAGEVVERPASVVKELVENSLDAGASRIELEIERGGTRLIRVVDNGKGIHQQDLVLALTRHATSKIRTSEDLAAICSLGFRGEALASVSAVSRLTLTSRTHDSDCAWQAMAQGRDMQVEISPAAGAPGTRLEVADLFYNTPARQKFLRSEKTEFTHIEDVFKQQALANPQVAFILKHNHKVVKRIPAIADNGQQVKRLASICGSSFAEQSIALDYQHELIGIQGWLGSPGFHRSESDIQYVFINARPVKDRTLNHAIKQAYEGLLPPGRMPAYVIFLSIDPHQVDVNVHPTKHEVRFSEQRLVHDMLAHSIKQRIQDYCSSQDFQFETQNQNQNHQVDELFVPEPLSQTGYAPAPTLPLSAHAVAEEAGGFDFSDMSALPSQSAPQSQSEVANQSIVANQSVLPSRSKPGDAPASMTATSKPVLSPHQIRVSETEQTAESAPAFHGLGGDFYWFASQEANDRQKGYLVSLRRLLAGFIENLLAEPSTFVHQSRALLFPQSISLSHGLIEDYQTHHFLDCLGFVTEVCQAIQLRVKAFPEWLWGVDSSRLLTALPHWVQLNAESDTKQRLVDEIRGFLSASAGLSLDYLFRQLQQALLASGLQSGLGQACRALPLDLLEQVFNEN